MLEPVRANPVLPVGAGGQFARADSLREVCGGFVLLKFTSVTVCPTLGVEERLNKHQPLRKPARSRAAPASGTVL